jgi:hypothetical protein
MKQFYFIKGEKTSKNDYYEFVNKKNLEAKLKKYTNSFNSIVIINGKMVNYENEEKNEIPTPLFYCDTEKIIIEVPRFYEYYNIIFLKKNILMIQTLKNEFKYSTKKFNQEPIELEKRNGILIFK